MRLVLFLCFTFISFNLASQESVLYGERHMVFTQAENTSRIFLDKNGDVYPKQEISNTQLAKFNGALEEYFTKQTAQDIGLNNPMTNEEYLGFQDSVRGDKIKEIQHQLDPNTELFILVHGFRKPLIAQPHSTSSEEDYDSVKSAISTNRPNSKIHFVEIYWDGTFIEVARKLSAVIQMGKLFKKKAVHNSTKVGLGLRNIIASIDHPKIHIIGHSLGAQVINNTLWNANVDSKLPTPNQIIDICLIAPAIGRKPFRKYDNRPSEVSWRQTDNYRFSIIYNERDIVVAKSNFGPRRYVRFTRFFGNTKLGCNCAKEAQKVKRRFRNRYPQSSVSLYDATAVGNNHRWSAYAQSDAFQEYLNSL